MKRIDDQDAKALLQLREPVNKFPDFVRYIVQHLKTLSPGMGMGKGKIAETLCRAGLHLVGHAENTFTSFIPSPHLPLLQDACCRRATAAVLRPGCRSLKPSDSRKWASKEGLEDEALLSAINEMINGLIDADLGGHVVKKRVALPGRGKRGSLRTLVAFKLEDKAVFIYGFAKNERTNINQKELKGLKPLAEQLLSYTHAALAKAAKAGELIEVSNDG